MSFSLAHEFRRRQKKQNKSGAQKCNNGAAQLKPTHLIIREEGDGQSPAVTLLSDTAGEWWDVIKSPDYNSSRQIQEQHWIQNPLHRTNSSFPERGSMWERKCPSQWPRTFFRNFPCLLVNVRKMSKWVDVRLQPHVWNHTLTLVQIRLELKSCSNEKSRNAAGSVLSQYFRIKMLGYRWRIHSQPLADWIFSVTTQPSLIDRARKQLGLASWATSVEHNTWLTLYGRKSEKTKHIEIRYLRVIKRCHSQRGYRQICRLRKTTRFKEFWY